MLEQAATLCLSLALHEGIVHSIYEDSLGYKTVGVGHKIIKEDPEWNLPIGSYVKEDRIIALFSKDCETAVNGAKAVLPFFDELPTDVQNILVEMTFQMGISGLKKFKKMIEALKYRDYYTASVEMLDSKWKKQTPNRAKNLSLRMEAHKYVV